MPIYEPVVTEFMSLAQQRGRLGFSTDLSSAVLRSHTVFIAVGTPSGKDGQADLHYVEAVARSIGSAMDDTRFRVVVNKSTVPLGCGNLVNTFVPEGIRARSGATGDAMSFGVASNPEFLREGSAISDSLYPDQIIIGTEGPRVTAIMRQVYGP